MPPTDANLIQQICRQDEAAFETLAARYRDSLARHLRRMVRDQSAAEDLLQELLLRVWARADQWDGRGSVRAWLFRIGTNLALNYLRTVRRRRELPLEPAPAPDAEEEAVPAWMIDRAAPGPEALAELGEGRARLRQLVEGLSEDKREVLRLVVDAELDLRQAAETLGIPEGTVKSRLYYARRSLERAWQDDEH